MFSFLTMILHVRLVYFASLVLVTTNIWNNGLKGLKQQTRLQLKETDLLLDPDSPQDTAAGQP